MLTLSCPKLKRFMISISSKVHLCVWTAVSSSGTQRPRDGLPSHELSVPDPPRMCTTRRSVEQLLLLLGTCTPARRRRLCNVYVSGWPWSTTITSTQQHVVHRPRHAHTQGPPQGPYQGPPVHFQSDVLRQAFKSLPPADSFKLGPLAAHQPQRPHTLAYYHAALGSLLDALRQGDSVKLYLCLMRLVRGLDHETGSWCFTEVVASIPATTFSEILRCFDPYNVSQHIDTAPGINISYNVALNTPLGELVNKWGVKLLYVRILNRLRRMQEARRHARIRPLLNDYVVLMKCAGATSDSRAAKDLWYSMKYDGYLNWRNSEAFAEFVKARFLTEKLYANNDLARLRLRPLDLHRNSIWIPGHLRSRLQDLRSHMTRLQKHRFGQNMHERNFAEPLTRPLRKRKPLVRLELKARQLNMLPGDERLMCAFLKANSHSGRLEASNRLLKMYWGISIQVDEQSGIVLVDGGLDYPQNSAMAPTEHLLDAVVHCYCSMGEVTVAVKLVDFISRRYSIPVPNQVWSDLLDYTRIMQTKPAANEWAIARFRQKVVKPDTVLDIWNICTQEPYNFQPGLQDYYNLIKSLIRKSGSVRRPIEALRQIKSLHDDAVRASEETWCELLQTTMQGVPNHAAYRRYREARARKDHVWYCFHYSSGQILKMIRPGRVDDDGGVREIPNLIGEFGQFMPRRIKYHIATGYVEFASENFPRRNWAEAQQVVEEPLSLSERPPMVDTQRDEEEQMEDRKEENWDRLEGYVSTIWDDMQIDEADADRSEHVDSISTTQQAGEDTASHPGLGTSTNKNKGTKGDSLDGDQRPSLPYLRSDKTSLSHGRWTFDRQIVEEPAYRYRPRFSGPSTEPSIVSIRQDGGEFTGYHDHLTYRHFAARQVVRTVTRAAGVPVDLELGGLSRKGTAGLKDRADRNETVRMAEQLLWVSR